MEGVVHLSGVFQLSPLLTTSVNIPAMNLNSTTAEQLSPLAESNLARLVTAGSHVRQLVVVGEHDSPAFKQQARQYTEMMRARGVKARLVEQLGEDHFSVVERLKSEEYSLTEEILKFMN